ncbi:MAG: calcium-binding protein [Cyanobacteria bacterium J06641_5]
MQADFFVPQASVQEAFVVEGIGNDIFQQLTQNLIFIPVGIPELDENEILQASLQNLFAEPDDLADVSQFLTQTGPQAILPDVDGEEDSFFENALDGIDDFIDDLFDNLENLFGGDDDDSNISDDEEPDTAAIIGADLTAEFFADETLAAAQLAFQEVDILGDGNTVLQFSEQAIADVSLFDGNANDGSFEDFLARTAGNLLLDSLQFALQDVIIQGNNNVVDQLLDQTIAAYIFLDTDELAEVAPLTQFAIQETFLGNGSGVIEDNFVTQDILQSVEIDLSYSDAFNLDFSTTAGSDASLSNFDIDTFVGTVLGEDIAVTGTQTSFQSTVITGDNNFQVQDEEQDLVQGAEADLVAGSAGDDTFQAQVGNGFDGTGDLIFAGAGHDTIDLNNPALGATAVPSNALAFGGSGDDELIAGGGDRLFGGSGDDILRATQSSGNNRLAGGAGNDEFFLSAGDRALGGAGDDRFITGTSGDNVLSGGAGADEFWLADGVIPPAANTITDFNAERDRLGIFGLGVGFDDLTREANTIALDGDTLAILLGVDTTTLDESSFVFAA